MTVSKAIENATPIVTTLSIMTLDNYSECRGLNCHADCCYAMCRYSDSRNAKLSTVFCQIMLTICQITIKPFCFETIIVRSNYYIFKYFEVMKDK
jgi:hypothetical protein